MDKSTRIKYTLVDNKFVSNRKFLGNEGTLLTAVISPGEGKFGVVKDVEGGGYSTVEEVSYTSFTKAKLEVKKLLKKYGVIFFEETRNKKGV